MAEPPAWDLLLRGAVGGVLLFHLLHLAGPGPRPATRLALAVFTASLIAYLFCQRPVLLMHLPLPLALLMLALCTSATAWLWAAARSLFDDGFAWRWPELTLCLGLVLLGLAANGPRLVAVHLGGTDPVAGLESARGATLSLAHALAMVALTGAALWEVLRGWRDDLVEPRRVARRWVALGIGLYAALALAVELSIRERPVGLLLPALHVLGIGVLAMALAQLVARRSLEVILGTPQEVPPAAGAEPAPSPAPVPALAAAAPRSPTPHLARLQQAMEEHHAYRREGLTLSALASELGLGEAALRALINQELGFRNFNDFLHHHRLREASARLASEDRPILSIALESGYGSIGPFNRAFRQRFGMTPTEYRAAHRLAQHKATG